MKPIIYILRSRNPIKDRIEIGISWENIFSYSTLPRTEKVLNKWSVGIKNFLKEFILKIMPRKGRAFPTRFPASTYSIRWAQKQFWFPVRITILKKFLIRFVTFFIFLQKSSIYLLTFKNIQWLTFKIIFIEKKHNLLAQISITKMITENRPVLDIMV